MARVEEFHVTNFVDTGLTSPFPRFTFMVRIRWIDDAGVPHTYGPVTHTFPNDLSSMPLVIRRRFAEKMIYAVARVSIGIDQWSDHE